MMMKALQSEPRADLTIHATTEGVWQPSMRLSPSHSSATSSSNIFLFRDVPLFFFYSLFFSFIMFPKGRKMATVKRHTGLTRTSCRVRHTSQTVTKEASIFTGEKKSSSTLTFCVLLSFLLLLQRGYLLEGLTSPSSTSISIKSWWKHSIWNW